MKRNINICIYCDKLNRRLSYCGLVNPIQEKQEKNHFNDREVPEKCVMKMKYEEMLKQLDTKKEKKTDNTFLGILEGMFKNQKIINDKKEIWTKINYEITDEEDGGKMINVTSHKVAFYFDRDGHLKGINTWK